MRRGFGAEDRMRGLAGPTTDPGWCTPCVVCGASCGDPGGRLFVMCGDCAQRMANGLGERRARERGEVR
jgi:hypothetical protein